MRSAFLFILLLAACNGDPATPRDFYGDFYAAACQRIFACRDMYGPIGGLSFTQVYGDNAQACYDKFTSTAGYKAAVDRAQAAWEANPEIYNAAAAGDCIDNIARAQCDALWTDTAQNDLVASCVNVFSANER